jgi:hypothetical protein
MKAFFVVVSSQMTLVESYDHLGSNVVLNKKDGSSKFVSILPVFS